MPQCWRFRFQAHVNWVYSRWEKWCELKRINLRKWPTQRKRTAYSIQQQKRQSTKLCSVESIQGEIRCYFSQHTPSFSMRHEFIATKWWFNYPLNIGVASWQSLYWNRSKNSKFDFHRFRLERFWIVDIKLNRTYLFQFTFPNQLVFTQNVYCPTLKSQSFSQCTDASWNSIVTTMMLMFLLHVRKSLFDAISQ